jgi:hypothetical protein
MKMLNPCYNGKMTLSRESSTIFSEKISIINGNPYVRPPDSVLLSIFKEAGKKTSPIPIKGKINGAVFQQSLVRYQGDWRLYVNIIMAKAAKIKFSKSISEIVGREAKFEVVFNPNPPQYNMVPFLKEALDKNSRAKNHWEKLTPGRQKEILRYFSWLKSEEARQRNLKKVIDVLSGKERRFMARSWKNGK